MTAPSNPESFGNPVDSRLSQRAQIGIDSRIAQIAAEAIAVYTDVSEKPFFEVVTDRTNSNVAAEAEIFANLIQPQLHDIDGTSGMVKDGIMLGHYFSERFVPPGWVIDVRKRQAHNLRTQNHSLGVEEPRLLKALLSNPTSTERRVKNHFLHAPFKVSNESENASHRQLVAGLAAWTGSIGVTKMIELQMKRSSSCDMFDLRRIIIAARITRFLPLEPPDLKG